MNLLSQQFSEIGKGAPGHSPNFLQNPLYRRVLHSEYAVEGSIWTEFQRHNILAVCNALVWQTSKQRSAVERIRFEDGKLGPILTFPENAHRLWISEIDIQIASSWIEDHCKKYCDRIVSRRSINRILSWLKDLGLVDWVDGVFDPKAPKSAAKSRTYTYIDIPRLLILMEATEDYLLHGTDRGREYGLGILPEHRYNSSRLVYEMIFPGFGWNRKGDGSELEPQTLEESLARRTFMAEAAEVRQGEYVAGSLSALLQAAELRDERLIEGNFEALAKMTDKDDQWEIYLALASEGQEETGDKWLKFCKTKEKS